VTRTPDWPHFPVEHREEVDSSNSVLLARAGELPDRHALWVDRQTAGRGRNGRSWLSPAGANLYLSLFARLSLPPARLGGLSLAMGVAVAEVVRDGGAVGVGLKWPNDLQVGGRKLGGLLVELTGSRRPATEVVIGLGLNLAMPPDVEPDQPWIDLAALGLGTRREDWLGRLLCGMDAALATFQQCGISAFQSRWEHFDVLRGKAVQVRGASRAGGVVLGIDPDGALLLQDAEGVWACHAGEVSVRLADSSDQACSGCPIRTNSP